MQINNGGGIIFTKYIVVKTGLDIEMQMDKIRYINQINLAVMWGVSGQQTHMIIMDIGSYSLKQKIVIHPDGTNSYTTATSDIAVHSNNDLYLLRRGYFTDNFGIITTLG